MSNLIKGGMLSGKKTYITAFVGVIGAIAAYLTGDADLIGAFTAIITSVSAATIRHSIK